MARRAHSRMRRIRPLPMHPLRTSTYPTRFLRHRFRQPSSMRSHRVGERGHLSCATSREQASQTRHAKTKRLRRSSLLTQPLKPSRHWTRQDPLLFLCLHRQAAKCWCRRSSCCRSSGYLRPSGCHRRSSYHHRSSYHRQEWCRPSSSRCQAPAYGHQA